MNQGFRLGFQLPLKDIAAMELPDFCARCFWYRMHCRDSPYSISPSTSDGIDLFSKNKKLARTIIDLLGQARKIYEAKDAPEGRDKCHNCMRRDRYIRQMIDSATDAAGFGPGC